MGAERRRVICVGQIGKSTHMKTFLVCQYEVVISPVLVEADDELEAIEKLDKGEFTIPDDCGEFVKEPYVGLDTSRGMSVEKFLDMFPHIARERAVKSPSLSRIKPNTFPSIEGVTCLTPRPVECVVLRTSEVVHKFVVTAASEKQALEKVARKPDSAGFRVSNVTKSVKVEGVEPHEGDLPTKGDNNT